MSLLLSLYDRFQEVIITGRISGFDAEIKPHPRLSARQQLAIYIDGYRIRLTGALSMDYPGLATYLGDKMFAEFAHDYIEEHPSQSYNLDHYGRGFASWLAQHSKDSFAHELALLEDAIAQSFMADESVAFSPDALANVGPEAFGAMTLRPRKSLRLLKLTHPVSHWLDKHRGTATGPTPKTQVNYLAVVRHRNKVKRVPLEQMPYLILSEIAGGQTVGWALDEVMMAHPDQVQEIANNLQPWFASWVAEGFFAAK